MTEFFDDEILEMAVAREVDANRFYLILAARVQDDDLRKIFEILADEELEHKAKLELEIMKTGRTVGANGTPKGLRDIKPDYMLPEFSMDFKDMLLIAMQKEDAAFRFYMDLAGMATDADSKEMLLELAREETGHKERFQTVYEHLFKEA